MEQNLKPPAPMILQRMQRIRQRRSPGKTSGAVSTGAEVFFVPGQDKTYQAEESCRAYQLHPGEKTFRNWHDTMVH